MNDSSSLPRSPELLTADDSVLLVVDVQDKLLRLTPDPQGLVFNIQRLLKGAGVLGVPIIATEQYPEKLGPTTDPLAKLLQQPAAKRAFSCGECGSLFQRLADQGISKLVIVGMETHVCVLQTAFDTLAAGFSVHLVLDALTARKRIDHDTAIRRMESSGASLTTTETVLFEWCESSTREGFKEISKLVRQSGP